MSSIWHEICEKVDPDSRVAESYLLTIKSGGHITGCRTPFHS